jgi:hypothetical protein
MKTTQVNAAEVMEVEECTPRAGVWFLNWRIKEKQISQRIETNKNYYEGSGIYALGYDNFLIYVGSYLGKNLLKGQKKNANFSGDIVKDRWWKHIETITSRGHKVHTTEGNLRKLRDELGDQHVMIDGFLHGDRDKLHKPNGADAALRRLKFAAKNSKDFYEKCVKPEDVLKRFTVVYVRFENVPEYTNSQTLKNVIDQSESRLIKNLAPLCNSKHVPIGKASTHVPIEEAAKLIEIELAAALTRLHVKV